MNKVGYVYIPETSGNEYMLYEAGKVYPEMCTHTDMLQFDLTSAGAVISMALKSPTEDEIANIRRGMLETRFTVLGDVIFIMVKFGGLCWTDMPYSPHLTLDKADLDWMAGNLCGNESLGLGLTVILFDSDTGKFLFARMVGLAHDFSMKLLDAAREKAEKPFNVFLYDSEINNYYRTYKTRDLVKMAFASSRTPAR